MAHLGHFLKEYICHELQLWLVSFQITRTPDETVDINHTIQVLFFTVSFVSKSTSLFGFRTHLKTLYYLQGKVK